MAGEVNLSAMHIGTAFRAQGVADDDGHRDAALPGVLSRRRVVVDCSCGCTPEQIIKALHDQLEPPTDTTPEEQL